MLFGKPKTILFTREEMEYIDESDRLFSSNPTAFVYDRKNYEKCFFSVARCVRLLSGSISSKDRVLVSDLTKLVTYSTGEFEKSIGKMEKVLSVQGSFAEASLVEKYKRQMHSLDIGKGILKKLDELK